jgi:drug/metabolite transporter (DMT)-like permease
VQYFGAIIFAFIAAFGNALFAAGQKKAVGLENGFSFIVFAATIAVVLIVAVSPFMGSPNYLDTWKSYWPWISLSGVGLFFVYLGFNLLYVKYGTSYYVLYAVISILTTSVLVGVVYYKETFNIYHWGALILSLITVVLFSLGEAKA